MTMRALNVAKELLLLSLHDVKGTVHCTASHALPYGIAGALLVEVAISGRLRADEKPIVVVDRAATGWFMMSRFSVSPFTGLTRWPAECPD